MLEKLYKVAICEELENEYLVNLITYNDTAFNYPNKKIIKLNSLSANIIEKYKNDGRMVFINKNMKYDEAMPNDLKTSKLNIIDSTISQYIYLLRNIVNEEIIQFSNFLFYSFTLKINEYNSKGFFFNENELPNTENTENTENTDDNIIDLYNDIKKLKKELDEYYSYFTIIDNFKKECYNLKELNNNEQETLDSLKKLYNNIITKHFKKIYLIK